LCKNYEGRCGAHALSKKQSFSDFVLNSPGSHDELITEILLSWMLGLWLHNSPK